MHIHLFVVVLTRQTLQLKTKAALRSICQREPHSQVTECETPAKSNLYRSDSAPAAPGSASLTKNKHAHRHPHAELHALTTQKEYARQNKINCTGMQHQVLQCVTCRIDIHVLGLGLCDGNRLVHRPCVVSRGDQGQARVESGQKRPVSWTVETQDV